ncbi:MAG TPA: GreA/GreB family elongation factor [Phycisphaerales bacterium]|nr:GreA/GreB family elongation factor [Phycisphaerales bacterium]
MELVTKAEREQIEARLAALVNNRAVLSTRIAEARALGDLKENGDYHAAREQQGIEESEIRRLQERLSNMSVIDEKMAKAVEGVVFIGSTVRLQEMTDESTPKGKKETIKLVGDFSGTENDEYDEVTATSPMGEALLKTRVGDIVRYNAPRGVKMYKVVEIL